MEKKVQAPAIALLVIAALTVILFIVSLVSSDIVLKLMAALAIFDRLSPDLTS